MADDTMRQRPNRVALEFRHRFADLHKIPAENFECAVFFDCAPLHALLLAFVIDNPRAPFFAADQELVARVAHARSVDEVRAAVSDFWGHPANDAWLRRVARVRISTRRLLRVAEQCFASDAAVPPNAT